MRSDKERAALRLLRDALHEFILIGTDNGRDGINQGIRDMPIARVLTLLEILVDDVDDLATLKQVNSKKYDLSDSASSRLLSWWTEANYLTDYKGNKKQGHPFLHVTGDVEDYRRKVIAETSASEEFASELAQLIYKRAEQVFAASEKATEAHSPVEQAPAYKPTVYSEVLDDELVRSLSTDGHRSALRLIDTVIEQNPRFANAVLHFAYWLKVDRQSSPHTLGAYANDLNRFFTYHAGKADPEPLSLEYLDGLKTTDHQQWLDDLFTEGLSVPSCSRALSVARSFVRWCIREDLLKNDSIFTSGVPKSKAEGGLVSANRRKSSEAISKSLPFILDALLNLTEDKQGKIKSWQASRDAAAFHLAMSCGFKPSRVLGMTLAEFVEARRTESIHRQGERSPSRRMYWAVSKLVNDYIERCPFALEADEPLFRGNRGAPYAARQFNEFIDQIQAELQSKPSEVVGGAVHFALNTVRHEDAADLRDEWVSVLKAYQTTGLRGGAVKSEALDATPATDTNPNAVLSRDEIRELGERLLARAETLAKLDDVADAKRKLAEAIEHLGETEETEAVALQIKAAQARNIAREMDAWQADDQSDGDDTPAVPTGSDIQVPAYVIPNLAKALPLLDEETCSKVLEWVAWLKTERRASGTTISAYQSDWAAFVTFMHNHLADTLSKQNLEGLTYKDMRAWLSNSSERGMSPASIARSLSVVRSFFRWASRQGYMNSDAVLSIRNPKASSTVPKALAISEVTDLFKAFDSLVRDESRDPADRWMDLRDRAILMLLYGCGLKISEALALNTDDVNRAQETGALAIIGKGSKARQVPFLNTVADAIRQYREAIPFDEDPAKQLFRGARGEHLSPRMIQKRLQELRVRLELPEGTTPQSVRHSISVHKYDKSMDMADLAELLGHSISSTTFKEFVDLEATPPFETTSMGGDALQPTKH